jgi:hypothetical protein
MKRKARALARKTFSVHTDRADLAKPRWMTVADGDLASGCVEPTLRPGSPTARKPARRDAAAPSTARPRPLRD